MKTTILALFLLGTSLHAQFAAPTKTPNIEVFFSPKGGCTTAIVNSIESAKKSILIQAYSFTSAQIALAAVNAKKRGVDVRVILDKSQVGQQNRFNTRTYLLDKGVPTVIDSAHNIAHNKVIIIDGEKVITGSFNFTRAAEVDNAENLLIISGDSDLAKKYTDNWNEHFSHSNP